MSLAAGLIATAVALGGCLGDDGDGDGAGSVAQSVSSQLDYLDPRSSLVAAIDLDYEGDNWEDLRPLASRVLQAYRDRSDTEDGVQVSPNIDGALEQLGSFGGVSFKDDIRPVLDGRLVIGVSLPARRPLPAEFAEVERLLEGAVFDPSRQVFVRPAPGARPPATTSPTQPRRVPGRVVRRSSDRPLTQQQVFAYQRARADREQAAEPRTVLVYRTRDGNLRELAREVFDRRELRPLRGHDDAARVDDGLAVVGDDTLVATLGADSEEKLLDAALRRQEQGRGFPQARLRTAERDAGLGDPLVLATGDLTLARGLLEEDDLNRSTAEIPYLRAFTRANGALDIGEREAKASVRVVTDGERLRERDLPVGPAGEIELPRTDGILGASRDQSRTTVFAASVVRSLFADSRFVDAVERAERELRIDFEDEVLRQFNCPSVSVFRPVRAAQIGAATTQRFGARSCVRDPERMRQLLPRLAPHLPRILIAMRSLGDRGLLGLLLVAPDAPLTPTALGTLAQIVVRPFKEDRGAPREELYEVDGLRQTRPGGPPVLPGPERVAFGMIGDAFVVGSSRAMAREAARLETEAAPEKGASALRAPVGPLLNPGRDDELSRALADVFGEVLVSFGASPAATSARARVVYKP